MSSHVRWARKPRATVSTAQDGQKEFTFKEMPAHRRKLAIRMANIDNHRVDDVPDGEQDFSLAPAGKKAAENNQNTVIRRKSNNS